MGWGGYGDGQGANPLCRATDGLLSVTVHLQSDLQGDTEQGGWAGMRRRMGKKEVEMDGGNRWVDEMKKQELKEKMYDVWKEWIEIMVGQDRRKEGRNERMDGGKKLD